MKKSWILYIIGISMLVGCKEGYRERFIRTIETENASCPHRLNESTIMDSAQYDANHNIIHYYYTLSGSLDNAAYMKENTAFFKKNLQNAVFNMVEAQEYVKHKTGFHFVYYSSTTGQVILEIEF